MQDDLQLKRNTQTLTTSNQDGSRSTPNHNGREQASRLQYPKAVTGSIHREKERSLTERWGVIEKRRVEIRQLTATLLGTRSTCSGLEVMTD
jgi:hypothetical protein